MAYIGSQPANIRAKDREVFTYTVAADNTTTFSGNDDAGRKLVYSLTTGNIEVFLNGIRLAAADYTATSSTSVVLAVGAYTGDIVNIITYNVLPVSDTVSKYNGGTFEGAVTLAGGVSGNLDVDGNIDIAGNITTTGIDDNATSTAVTIDASGNVVIGNSTAVGKLDVYTPAGEDAKLIVRNGTMTNPKAMIELRRGPTSSSFGGDAYSDWRILNEGGILKFISADTTWTEGLRMSVDYRGYLSTPSQPSFHAFGNNGMPASSTAAKVAWPSTRHNVGNHYDASTGNFTAPVAGTYMFGWTTIAGNTNTTWRLWLYINNVRQGDIHLRLDTEATGSEYGTNGMFTLPLQLNANDQVSIWAANDAGYSWYGSGQTDNDYYRFWGYLLG